MLENLKTALEEYAKNYGEDKIGPKLKYVRDVKKLSSTDLYKRYYGHYLDLS